MISVVLHASLMPLLASKGALIPSNPHCYIYPNMIFLFCQNMKHICCAVDGSTGVIKQINIESAMKQIMKYECNEANIIQVQ